MGPDSTPTWRRTPPPARARRQRIGRQIGAALLACAVWPVAVWAAPGATNACTARSGPARATLVELYTSEGCSSCPPADARLSQLDTRGGRIVPLALHVPYWDAIGWKDPYAQPAFAARQRWLANANGQPTVYTPHYFVNGRQALDWRRELAPALKTSAAAPAPAQAEITLQVQPLAGGAAVQAQVLPRGGVADAPWQLVLALTESALVSTIDAGENRGATLHHDHVVRQWLGPYAVASQRASVSREVRFDPGWRRSQLGLTAFVQDTATGEVLQALAMPLCEAAP